MKSFQTNRHMSALIFTISLFLLYMILAISVILCGTSVYQKVSRNSEINNNVRTSLSYISEKIRQNDINDGIRTETLDVQGTPIDAILLTSSYNNKDYITYIYPYNGGLYELFTSADTVFSPSAGNVLTELTNMHIQQSEYNSSIIQITITDSLNTDHTLFIHPQSVSTDLTTAVIQTESAEVADCAVLTNSAALADCTILTDCTVQENLTFMWEGISSCI